MGRLALLAAGLCITPVLGCASDDGQAAEQMPTASQSTTSESGSVPWKRIASNSWTGRTPPLAGKPITLRLITAGSATQGAPYEFVVRIGNAGSAPISLDPCPAYRVQYLPHVEGGQLNCEEAPAAIPPRGHLDFQMQIDVLDLGSPTMAGSYTLLWQLGVEGFEGKTVRTDVPLSS